MAKAVWEIIHDKSDLEYTCRDAGRARQQCELLELWIVWIDINAKQKRV